MKWLENRCRESAAFAWGLTAAGIVLMILVAFI